MIFYKRIIREFLKNFRKKYFKIKEFRSNFKLEKDFKISINERHELELEKGRKTQLANSNYYAFQLHNNAIQTKLQSRR